MNPTALVYLVIILGVIVMTLLDERLAPAPHFPRAREPDPAPPDESAVAVAVPPSNLYKE